MIKATDELLKDHKMIRKAMEEWNLDNPRFAHLHQTLQRIVVGHAWFEDQVFFPAMELEPLIVKKFLNELYQEHKDIDFLLKLVRRTSTEKRGELESSILQLRVLLETHFAKEEEAIFPICEKVLDAEGLNNLGEEMRRRQHEMREKLNVE